MSLYKLVKDLLETSNKGIADLASSMNINIGSVSRKLIKGKIDSKLVYSLALVTLKSTNEIRTYLQPESVEDIDSILKHSQGVDSKSKNPNSLSAFDLLKQENDDLARMVVAFNKLNIELSKENSVIKEDVLELIKQNKYLDDRARSLQSKNNHLKQEIDQSNIGHFSVDGNDALQKENDRLNEEIKKLSIKDKAAKLTDETSEYSEILKIQLKRKDTKIIMLEAQIAILKDEKWTK